MKWIEPNIDSICTKRIIYFSDEHKETCEKICDVLKIDLFPDADHNSYKTLIDGKWEKEKITDEQKITIDLKIFDTKKVTENKKEGKTKNQENEKSPKLGKCEDNDILEKMERSKSNILFCYKEDLLSGIIHFSNYNTELVYKSLYQNFYTFETNLREHLISLNISYKDFEDYYKIKSNKDLKVNMNNNNENTPKSHNTKKLEYLQSQKFKDDSNKLRPLQLLTIKELLSFSISSYHCTETLEKIGLSGIQEANISDLRNTIMHSKDFTGATENLPFVLETFVKFFKQVLEFRKAFLRLSEIREKQAIDKKIKYNKYILKQIGDMEDNEIEDFFYNRL